MSKRQSHEQQRFGRICNLCNAVARAFGRVFSDDTQQYPHPMSDISPRRMVDNLRVRRTEAHPYGQHRGYQSYQPELDSIPEDIDSAYISNDQPALHQVATPSRHDDVPVHVSNKYLPPNHNLGHSYNQSGTSLQGARFADGDIRGEERGRGSSFFVTNPGQPSTPSTVNSPIYTPSNSTDSNCLTARIRQDLALSLAHRVNGNSNDEPAQEDGAVSTSSTSELTSSFTLPPVPRYSGLDARIVAAAGDAPPDELSALTSPSSSPFVNGDNSGHTSDIPSSLRPGTMAARSDPEFHNANAAVPSRLPSPAPQGPHLPHLAYPPSFDMNVNWHGFGNDNAKPSITVTASDDHATTVDLDAMPTSIPPLPAAPFNSANTDSEDSLHFAVSTYRDQLSWGTELTPFENVHNTLSRPSTTSSNSSETTETTDILSNVSARDTGALANSGNFSRDRRLKRGKKPAMEDDSANDCDMHDQSRSDTDNRLPALPENHLLEEGLSSSYPTESETDPAYRTEPQSDPRQHYPGSSHDTQQRRPLPNPYRPQTPTREPRRRHTQPQFAHLSPQQQDGTIVEQAVPDTLGPITSIGHAQLERPDPLRSNPPPGDANCEAVTSEVNTNTRR